MRSASVAMSVPRFVAAGIDTLYFSVRGELVDGFTRFLRAMREMAGGEASVFELRESDQPLMLRSHGWRGYPFWVSAAGYELMVGAAKPFPPVYVQLHSAFIHSLGAEVAVAELETRLRTDLFPNGLTLIPSRIDVYADVQGWIPTAGDLDRFVCRGTRRRMYETQVSREMHSIGRRLSGFTFGKGDVVARIYDKTLETAAKGETWQRVIWTGVDEMAPVWRVEFQFRRGALVSLGIGNVGAALWHRQELWRYGTGWLSLRQPTAAAQSFRWPEDAVWKWLRTAEIGFPATPLVRERIRDADERRLVAGFLGYVASLAAITGTEDVDSALQRARPLAVRYLKDRGAEFSERVRQKKSTNSIRDRELRVPAPKIMGKR